jgi:hypothetical protein
MLSYKISCDLLSSLWGETNSRIFLKILEHYFREHQDSHHKIIREILEFKAQYRLCLSLKKIEGLGNWRIKRFIVDCGFFLEQANIGNIIGIERGVKPSTFIKKESKNIIALNKPLIKRVSAGDEFIENKVNKAKISILNKSGGDMSAVEERIKESEKKIRGNAKGDKDLFRVYGEEGSRKNFKFLKKHLSDFEKSRIEVRNEIIAPTFKDVLKRGLESDKYDKKEKAIIKKFTHDCNKCLEKVKAIKSDEFHFKIVKSARRKNLTIEQNIERKEKLIRNKVSNKLSGSFFLCKQYKNALYTVKNEFEILSGVNSSLSSDFSIEEIDKVKPKLEEEIGGCIYETFKKVKKIKEYIELKEEENVYRLIKQKAGQINDIKREIDHKFDEWSLNKERELRESKEKIIREDEEILEGLNKFKDEINNLKCEISDIRYELGELSYSYSRGDIKLKDKYKVKLTGLLSTLKIMEDQYKIKLVECEPAVRRDLLRSKISKCKSRIKSLESEICELNVDSRQGRTKRKPSVKVIKRIERLSNELCLEKAKLSKLEKE